MEMHHYLTFELPYLLKENRASYVDQCTIEKGFAEIIRVTFNCAYVNSYFGQRKCFALCIFKRFYFLFNQEIQFNIESKMEST